jgi:hypothetical protein
MVDRMPKRSLLSLLLMLLALTTAGMALAKPADLPPPPAEKKNDNAPPPSRGKMLYENHCTECHTSVVHIRKDHRADTPAAIRSWVFKWANYKQLKWSAQDIDDVTDYLSEHYYGFGATD